VTVGYWHDNNNCRKFFCEYAEKAGFDPMNPNNWTNVKRQDIQALKVKGIFLFFLTYSNPLFLYFREVGA